MKVGDKVICTKLYVSSTGINFYKNHIYQITDYGITYDVYKKKYIFYKIKNDTTFNTSFDEKMFNNYFISLVKARKLKLEKLNSL